MAPLPLVISVSNVLGSQYLTPSGQRIRSSKGIIIGAFVNLFFNMLLIPKLGSIGSALGSIVAEATISVIYVFMSRGYTSWKLIWGSIWKRLIAGLIMLIGVILIGLDWEGNLLITILRILSGAIVYCLFLLIEKETFLKNY